MMVNLYNRLSLISLLISHAYRRSDFILLGFTATSNERDALIAKELAALKDVQSELTTMLKELLLGDELAAQYLLCHLISSVHR